MPSDRASATHLVRKFNIATAKNGGAERNVTVCLFVQPLWPMILSPLNKKGANSHPPPLSVFPFSNF
jgi:hypothetical protein